jgi:hypothetical protein
VLIFEAEKRRTKKEPFSNLFLERKALAKALSKRKETYQERALFPKEKGR